jgi:hypothetical protein
VKKGGLKMRELMMDPLHTAMMCNDVFLISTIREVAPLIEARRSPTMMRWLRKNNIFLELGIIKIWIKQ